MSHHRNISPSPQRLNLIEFIKDKESCVYDRLTKEILHGIWPQDFPSNHQHQILLGIWPWELAVFFLFYMIIKDKASIHVGLGRNYFHNQLL